MTQSDILNYIKMELGASHRPLEIDDNGIMDIIINRTLPTFSFYFPLFHPIEVVPVRDIVKAGDYGKYYLRDENVKILSVAKVLLNENAVMFRNRYGNDITNLFDLQCFTDMWSAVYTPETFLFTAPCTLELFPKYYNQDNFLVICAVEHPSHLNTIPYNGLHDQFLALALADVKIALLAIRKNFSSVNSIYGNIELGLDLLESGKEDRKELIEIWRKNFLKEPNRKKIYFY